MKIHLSVTLFVIHTFVHLLKAVYCEPPPVPANGRLLGGEKHLVGDKIRYECEEGHILIGESYVFCVGQGVWDNPFPTCK